MQFDDYLWIITFESHFGTGGREVVTRFYAMIIIVKCRRKLACPGLRWLTFSGESNGFVLKIEPI